MKTINEIVNELYKVSTPSWGQEIEYNPRHYDSLSPSLIFVENEILMGLDDGSGPREARLIPCYIGDYDCLRFNTTLLQVLKIPFDKSDRRMSYGRHIHMRFEDLWDANYLSRIYAEKNIQYAILFMAPFNGWVEYTNDNYIKVQFRKTLRQWATPFASYHDHYYFMSINTRHNIVTIENRLNEKHPAESYASTLGFYAMYKMELFPYKIEVNGDTIILKNGAPVLKWDIYDATLVINFEVFTKIMRDVFAYISDIVSKKVMKHVYNVYKNTLKKEEIMRPGDVDFLYPYLLIEA